VVEKSFHFGRAIACKKAEIMVIQRNKEDYHAKRTNQKLRKAFLQRNRPERAKY
jgi:hypothetical protein